MRTFQTKVPEKLETQILYAVFPPPKIVQFMK